MKNLKNIPDSELKLLEIIWEKEPIKSGELVAMCFEAHNWKKSTVYTILKKLVNKGLVVNENSQISSVAKREEVMSQKTEAVINKAYGGSLPMFLAAFLSNERLTKKEAEQLKKLIDSYTEK